MSAQSRFDKTTARRLEGAYKTPDASRRRSAVREALAPAPGERVIDIGTGPGFIPFEFAPFVLPGGGVLGVDISEPMLELARARCTDLAHVRFANADASHLPVSSGSYEAAVAIQIFEYVDAVDQVIRELNRILRVGGRVAIVSTDWPSIAWHSSSDDRMRLVLDCFSQHCPHQALPRSLAGKLRSAGFVIDDQRVLPQFNPDFQPDAFSVQLIDVVASFVSRRGVPNEEARAWAEDLRRRGENGEYFFCLNQFLVLASKVDDA